MRSLLAATVLLFDLSAVAVVLWRRFGVSRATKCLVASLLVGAIGYGAFLSIALLAAFRAMDRTSWLGPIVEGAGWVAGSVVGIWLIERPASGPRHGTRSWTSTALVSAAGAAVGALAIQPDSFRLSRDLAILMAPSCGALIGYVLSYLPGSDDFRAQMTGRPRVLTARTVLGWGLLAAVLLGIGVMWVDWRRYPVQARDAERALDAFLDAARANRSLEAFACPPSLRTEQIAAAVSRLPPCPEPKLRTRDYSMFAGDDVRLGGTLECASGHRWFIMLMPASRYCGPRSSGFVTELISGDDATNLLEVP